MSERVMFEFTYEGKKLLVNADYIAGVVELEDNKTRIVVDGTYIDVDQSYEEVLRDITE